jgi:hypothetical protein
MVVVEAISKSSLIPGQSRKILSEPTQGLLGIDADAFGSSVRGESAVG